MGVSAIIALIGAGISAGGQIKSSRDKAKAFRMALVDQRTVDRENLKRFKEETDAMKARQRVAFAKGGVEVNTGSPLLNLSDMAYKIDRDVRGRIWRSSRTAQSYMRDIQNVKTSGNIAGAGTVLTGFSNAYALKG